LIEVREKRANSEGDLRGGRRTETGLYEIAANGIRLGLLNEERGETFVKNRVRENG